MIVEGPIKSTYESLGGHQGILRLVRTFYADVRQHERLGPIFNSHIHDWEDHLAKITEFWALQTGGPTNYRGGFAGAHLKVSGIRVHHFDDWLELWDYNCRRHLEPPLAKEMSRLAHTLGNRLKRIIHT